MRVSLEQLNVLDPAGFAQALDGLFEHSPWVVERAARARPFADRAALEAAFARVVAEADEAEQLALLRAHPDLAGKAARAGDLTEASKAEQAGAGLDRLSDAEWAEFHALNGAYRERFGFPFILAVKGAGKERILAAFRERIGHAVATERATALAQVLRIAGFRLDDRLDPG